MELLREEVDLKSRAMKLMKKYGKSKYKHNGIEILIEPGEETIKVKVRKAGEDVDDDETGAPDAPPVDSATDAVEGETLADA